MANKKQIANTPTRPALGMSGMISSAHPIATQAGLDILTAGGNAFDAAVAIAASRISFIEPDVIGIEEGISESVRGELSAMGHDIRIEDRIGNAHGLTIERDPKGSPTQFTGGADPRGEGAAMGYQ